MDHRREGHRRKRRHRRRKISIGGIRQAAPGQDRRSGRRRFQAAPGTPAAFARLGTMQAASRSSARREETLLRNLIVATGVGWSLAFVALALVYELQLYADGAMFSYAVAVQDVWAFHWHNIANRITVFFLTLWPAETYVGLTG